MFDETEIVDLLQGRFGIGLDVISEVLPEGMKFEITSSDLKRSEGFISHLIFGWGFVEAVFTTGDFASGLIYSMRNVGDDKRASFKTLVQQAERSGAQVKVFLGNDEIDLNQQEFYGREWVDFKIVARKPHITGDWDDYEFLKEQIVPWIILFFGIHMAHISTEQAPDAMGESEGSTYQTTITRYERSPANRKACLEYHGLNCLACGLDFSEKYGPIGSGFIHVHHKEPLSMMAASYELNPREDLVPLCPNCHSMVHRRKPPYSVDELKGLMNS